MKDYMTTLGVLLILIAFSDMLIPEGSIKKYVSLAMGFMLIAATLSLIPAGSEKTFLSADSYALNEEEIATSEAQYRAEVLKRHRENLEKSIEKEMTHGGRAYVEVSPQGEVTSVTLSVLGDESKAVLYIVENLGVPRERIKLRYDKN